MRYFFLLILLFSFEQIGYAQVNLREFALKGRVKELVEYSYNGKPNELRVDTSNGALKTITIFDENGRVLEEKRFNLDNSLERKTVCSYVEKGIIEVNQFNAQNETMNKFIMNCDEKGNVVKVERYISSFNGAIFRTEKAYDNYGNCIFEIGYDVVRNKMINKDTLIYGKKNEKIEEDSFNYQDSVKSKTFYKYSSTGRILETDNTSTFFDSKNTSKSLSHTFYDKWDRHDNWLSETYIYVSELNGTAFNNKLIVKRIIKYF